MSASSEIQSRLEQCGIREVWCWDTEFEPRGGDHPRPVVLAAQNVFTGEKRVVWLADGERPVRLPFDTGPHSLAVAYYAVAELRCALTLGLPLPENNICLFAEHRAETNGRALPLGNGLIGALTWRGLPAIDADTKTREQEFASLTRKFDAEGRQRTIDYCMSDVASTIDLFLKMAPNLQLTQALVRGRYTKAAARIEHNGVPIDTMRLGTLIYKWDTIVPKLITHVDSLYDIYEGETLKVDRLSTYARRYDIPWPRTESGRLAIDKKTLKGLATAYPQLKPLYDLRRILSVRLPDLPIGQDGRCRTSLSPFRSKTSRNQPSTAKYPFGLARDLRCLIKPAVGEGISYIDWSSQEIAIAAGLSGDQRLANAYNSGDPYLAFAIDAGLAPADASTTTHKVVRDRCKEVVLGMNYGLGAKVMAAKSGLTEAEARELIHLHKRTYSVFWDWLTAMVAAGQLSGKMRTVGGWLRYIDVDVPATSLMNFPMQANGAEMMRLAAISATEAGIEVCAPVHDAFLINAPLDRLDGDVAAMRSSMAAASRAVTGSIEIRTDAKVFRYPERYVDERGAEMWDLMMQLAGIPEAA